MKKALLFFFAITFGVVVHAQFFGCAGADDLNSTNAFTQPGSPEDTTIDYGCINAATQWVWYGYLTVCQGGTLDIAVNTGSSSNDVDLVVYGPFANTIGICSQLTAANIVGCAATTTPNETVSVGNVLANQVYMVVAVCDSNLSIPGYYHNGTAVVTGACLPNSNCMPVMGYESLCYVTVDSATQEYKMIWTELPGNPVSYFGIMKADYLGIYQQIDTVQLTSLSEYIDTSADPNLHTERYSIVTWDTCGTYWALTGNYIQPVFCQSSLSTQGTVNVAWSAYDDTWMNGPAYYVIYRGATPANMISIDTVAWFVNNYTDVNPLVGTSYYKIGTALYSTCVPMRLQQSAQTQYQVQSFSNAAPITVVGIGENSLQEVSLFPNPTEGILTLVNVNRESSLRVYDVAGRVVVQQNVQPGSAVQISLENLDAGLYSVTLENETGFFRKEIMVQH